MLAFWADGSGEDGQRTGLNDAGQLVFSAAFTDQTTGVFVVNFDADLPGDYNHDGTVDAADYVAWRKGVGVASTPDNYNLWRTNFGESNGGSGATAGGSAFAEANLPDSAVPEPASLALLLVAAFYVLIIPRPWAVAKNHC